MSKLTKIIFSMSFICVLISCTNTQTFLNSTQEMIKPGDQLGEMTIEQSTQVPYQNLWWFCDILPDEFEPFTFSNECDIPPITVLDISIGWLAKASIIEANWEEMEFKASIDGRELDLNSFEWFETEYPQHIENNVSRTWTITIKNLSPGKHTFSQSWTSSNPIDDGYNTYQPGTYSQILTFTVLEKADYPELTSEAKQGQYAYSSKQAQLDFLLYLPDSYRKDPQQEWPLIVYLHGAIWRGATPEMLKEESLPRKLEGEDDFPFFVISPMGEGEFEFWATEEMINALFLLLEEVQNKFSIDPNRIYLTGNDMGGNGVWTIGLRYPEYFAALAPVSGYFGYPFELPKNICALKDVPVWAFHGQRDEIIPIEAEKQLVDALNACGGNATFSISPDMEIDVKIKVYGTSELYEWLLVQTRE